MTTKVIFRKFPEGDIIALFPGDAGDNIYWRTCLSYMHIGQHGSASVDLSGITKLASPDEYKDLLNELISIGYDDLVIVTRFTRKDLQARKNQTERN